MTQTCSTPYQSKNFGMDNPSQQGLTWASHVWRYWYLQQSTQISRTSFQQANITVMQFGNKKTVFPYENMGFHPPVHRAALWCHVCFWETVLNNWTWVELQKLGNEFAGPRQRDFLCFQTYIQIVLENLVLVSGPRVHDHNVTKPKSAEQDGKCALLTNRGQKKLGYVSHWHDGGLGIAVLKKINGQHYHAIWGTVFGLCHALKGCFFASATFSKKGLIDVFIRIGHQCEPIKIMNIHRKKTDQQPTEMRYVSSNKSSIIALLLKLNLFLSQIIWSAPTGLSMSPPESRGGNPNEVKLLELSISAGLATMLRNTCCTHSLRRPVASTPGPSLAASFSCGAKNRRATSTCSWLKLKIK